MKVNRPIRLGGGHGPGQFSEPYGLAIDRNGDVYVADYNNRRIQKFTTDGSFVTEWGGHSAGDGEFSYPIGVATDTAGNVYVVDASNNRVQVFTADGASPPPVDRDPALCPGG